MKTTKQWDEESLRMPVDGTQFIESTPGIELRDWFAGLALQGILTHDDEGLIPEAAQDAYRYADAMLKAREVSDEIRNEH